MTGHGTDAPAPVPALGLPRGRCDDPPPEDEDGSQHGGRAGPLTRPAPRRPGRRAGPRATTSTAGPGHPGRHAGLRQGDDVAAREDAGPILNGLPSQLPDIDPDETAEWLASLDARRRRARPRPRPLPHARPAAAGPRAGRRRPEPGVDGLHQHDPAASAEPWFPGDEEAERRLPALDPLERRGHGAPRPARRHRRRRPHLDVRVVRDPLRGRLQPLLPRQGPPRRRRPGLHPGPRLPRHLRPGLPRGPADATTSSTASARRSRTRPAGCPPTRTRG